MLPVNWSNRFLMGYWFPICVFLMTVPTVSRGNRPCPHDVETHANACFTSYSFHSQSVYNSPQKLCCGIDVETLRAFCHSFSHAVKCIDQLRRSCPASADAAINKALVNLEESNAGLMDLCHDDSVIESYAMYQSCYTYSGPQSERCFSTYLKDSAAIRFLSKVNYKHKGTFCRNMRSTVKCVYRHVEQTCGPGAAGLSALLVRPMVRESSLCDYTVVDNNTMDVKPNPGDNPAYISDDSRSSRRSKGSQGHHGNGKTHNHRRHHGKHKNNKTSGDNKTKHHTNRNTKESQNGAKPKNNSAKLCVSGFTFILAFFAGSVVKLENWSFW